MLDSLVRVSRRVGGATDLLATEMRPVQSTQRDHSHTCRPHTLSHSSSKQACLPLRLSGMKTAVRCVECWRSAASHQTNCTSQTLRNRKAQMPSSGLEPPTQTSRTPPFTTKQFHVLLNSLFKVLFNLPSPYLFAIGLRVIFRLMRSLPHTLGCTPKQPDSREKSRRSAGSLTGLSPSMGYGHSQVGL